MVQVDVFWAYALGGSLAEAGGDKMLNQHDSVGNHYFAWTMIFLSVFWAPTGMYLLAQHPSWETMQVYDSISDIPPWLIVGFGLTNITQGILGYFTTRFLMKSNLTKFATLNWMLGYFLLFFVLIYGWDGTGIDRFLYDRDCFNGTAWTAGAGFQEGAGVYFLISSVAKTLYIEGAYLLIPYFLLVARWAQHNRQYGIPAILKLLMRVFLMALPAAILCAAALWLFL